MKVSRTAAVLVGCALAATADVVSGHGNTRNHGRPGKAASDMEAASGNTNTHGNHHHNDEQQHDAKKKKRAGHRALRGGSGHAAESGKTAKTHGDARTNKKKNGHNKKRSLKSSKGAGGGGNGANRAYTAYTAYNNGNGQAAVDNTPYINNKHDYLDRYSAYLTPEQLQRLRTNSPPADQKTNVGGTETAVVSTPAGSVGRPAAGSSYSQTAAVQQGPATTPYVSTLSREDGGNEEDSNDLDNPRGFDATSGANVDALNRGFEAEAQIPNYNPATGYGSTGNGGDAANANGGGALDAPVQTTEWKPIDKAVWVEHYNVPGVGRPTDPAVINNGNGNFNNGNMNGGGSANFNSNANFNTVNRISANEAPCNGANPNAAPSRGIQHVFENTLWGTCSTTEGGCQPGSCCFFHPEFNRGACVPFSEICEPEEKPGEGGCPYPWMTSDKCRCAGSGGALPSF